MATIITHAVLDDALGILRSVDTGISAFRSAMSRAASVLAVEALKNVPTTTTTIRTPIADTFIRRIDGSQLVFVPILRAGLSLLESFVSLAPEATVAHLGLYRDHKTLLSVEYFQRIPDSLDKAELFILDPMLATGNSSLAAYEKIKDRGASSVTLVSLLAAPEGIENLERNAPELRVIAGALDERLNEHGYIVPGLGDAGDRYFGT